jgi:hypothetical protein
LNYISLSDLDPNKVYKLKLAVGAPWHETNKFFTVINCSKNPHKTDFVIKEDTKLTNEVLEALSTNETIITDDVNVRIYPNPTKDDIFIDVGDNKEIHTVKIYNFLGEKIINKKLDDRISNVKIDLLKLSSGIYLVIVSDKNDQPIKISKLIKN